jgi:hypothetical protein
VPSNLSRRHPLHLELEQLAFARPAEFQNAGNVNGRRIYPQLAVKLRQWLMEALLSLLHSAIHIQGDRIHPGEQHVVIAQLT